MTKSETERKYQNNEKTKQKTKTKLCFALTPKDIIQLSTMPSFKPVNLPVRSRLRAQEPIMPRASFLIAP